ncbi:MAG TPA: hypothetical protein VFU45_00040 [Gemmatimonadales bacterium]|nr:hypothetical protein [Gemmatimonadales bacterium]
MRPDSLAVLGLGATGASAAWSARTAGVPRVLGWAASRADATSALRAGAVDDLTDRADRAVTGAAVVLVADAPGTADQVLRRVAGSLRPDALVLLLSEVHGAALATAGALGLGDRTAALDPMGESPGPGFAGAGPDRLRGRLTYVSSTDTEAGHQAARSAMSFVEEILGGAPVLIDPARHDEQVAWTRQLPGAALAVLCHLLDGRRLGGVTWDAAARSARAGVPADADVAADVLLADRRAVAMALGALGAEVEVLRKLVDEGNGAGVRAFLERAAQFRPGPS